MDFTSDQLADGRRFRTFNVVDDCSRECLAIRVERSISGDYVARVLTRLIEERRRPAIVVCDNGPFISRALEIWSEEQGVKLHFIEPGKPVQNCYVESFNGRFRDECLNENWFTSIEDARTIIAAWREDYNDVREHGSLGGMTPNEYRRAVESPGKRFAFPALPTAPTTITTAQNLTFPLARNRGERHSDVHRDLPEDQLAAALRLWRARHWV